VRQKFRTGNADDHGLAVVLLAGQATTIALAKTTIDQDTDDIMILFFYENALCFVFRSRIPRVKIDSNGQVV